MSAPLIGSLFSGYGGLDLAVESVTGAEPAWFVEFDAAPSKILAHHWPEVPNYGDVTKVDWDQVPRVDILTGGTPCQDLSHAGKRAGMTEGTRSNLWVNMREAIIHLHPQLVVWENVLGALSAKATSDSDMEPGTGLLGDGGGGHLRALGRVLGDLAEIGYDAQWTTLRASDIGAPHHRARVFLIAWPRVQHTGHDAGRAELGEQHEVPPPWPGEPGQDTADSDGGNERQRQRGSTEPELPVDNNGECLLPDAGGSAVREQSGGASSEETGASGRDRSGDPRGERPHGHWWQGAADTQSVGPGDPLKLFISGVRPTVGGGRQDTPADSSGGAGGVSDGDDVCPRNGGGQKRSY